jgi:glycyl-tRNA synthetase beta chain
MSPRESLLLEIGTEELPPTSLKTLGLAFRDGILAGLAARDLEHGAVRWFATPRRLAVIVDTVSLQAPSRRIEILGPPAERARSENGDWSPAALGFARKQGVEPDALEVLETPKGARLGLRQEQAGSSLRESLMPLLTDSLDALPIARRMRWGRERAEFVRPVHWLVALLGTEVIEGEIFGIKSGRHSRGHRFHSSTPIEIDRPENYEALLARARVVADFEQRRAMIIEQVNTEASALKARAVMDEDLLDEVTGLVEWPVALTGGFDRRFLDVPPEALISSMKEHQKYFHCLDEAGQLMPHFITVSNIESRDPVQVIAGNERVIRPRLADAAFFYEQDCRQPLADKVERLRDVVFQKSLGTLHDKTQRIAALAARLAETLGADVEQARRAGLLAKADLVSELVLEFGDLQGIAGAYYARNDGEPEAVAEALQQQYWPRFAGDRLPEQGVATCLALADRLDTLVGIFGIGQPPTGSRDPFALRRASLAVLRILTEKSLDLDLADCLRWASEQYPSGVLEGGVAPVLDYVLDRFRAWFEDEGIATESFRAVSALALTRPLDIQRRVHAVHRFSTLNEAAALAEANKRVANILEKVDADHRFAAVEPEAFSQDEERALWDSLQHLGDQADTHLAAGAYTEALETLAGLREPVDTFFDRVMVNAEEENLRRNRLNLLHALRTRFLQVADISQLVVSR